ncbi:MAG: LacI family DNA-binding transcriptional regulator [Anaerolineales bacterium]|nr:LacI family DNA-binding transcriptional regulator [Anaerolineales bacterium]
MNHFDETLRRLCTLSSVPEFEPMPTMSDVARANVSLSTVSYAINGTRPISEETCPHLCGDGRTRLPAQRDRTQPRQQTHPHPRPALPARRTRAWYHGV